MAIMKKIALKEKYVQVPNATAKAVERKSENPLSLQGLGLLVNLWAYDLETWDLHKTELYQRFIKNKKTSVMSAWDDLVEANFMIEFKYRKGKAWDYVYLYRIEPFSEEEKKELIAQCVDIYEVSSTSDFQLLKLGSSKCTVQNQHISNIKKSNTNKSNDKLNIVNKKVLTDIFNEFYSEFANGRWSKKEWKNLVNKLSDELLDDRGFFTKANDPISYVRGCLKMCAHHHDRKNDKKEFIYQGTTIPLYDWLK